MQFIADIRRTDLLLARLKQIAVPQKEGLHLIDTSRSDEDEVEDRKDSELEIKGAVPDLPECEAAEKSSENVQVDLVPDVILKPR